MFLAITAVAHSIAINSTPSLSKDVIVIIVEDPLIASTVVDYSTHAETQWQISLLIRVLDVN